MEKVLTKNFKADGSVVCLADYVESGGYASLKAALAMKPEDIVALVRESGLRGRGGAGFPTAFKWAAVPPLEQTGLPRILICNFDEMEPGTFKDRFLVERDPHQLIEGLLVAAYACQANLAYIFIRAEYKALAEMLLCALDDAQNAGYWGKNVLDSGWNLDIHLHVSAGRYMCGEETGLLNALEGKPANPRSKPPYPQTSGAWGRPTVVQNVETLSCVPHIIENGADWFKGLSKGKDAGTKLYGISGKVKNPGCWEMPMGTTLRELIFENAGGMQDGYSFRAALPGGASTRFMGPEHLDLPLDFESLKSINGFMGTGTAIILDDKTCPVAASANLQAFYVRESCGWCTPCREGLPWILDLLKDIEAGHGEPGDIELILDQAKFIGPNTYCAFAMGAVQPLVSAIDLFREDFDRHIDFGRCPFK